MHAYLQFVGGLPETDRETIRLSIETSFPGMSAHIVRGSIEDTLTCLRCSLSDLPEGFEPLPVFGMRPETPGDNPSTLVPGMDTKAEAIVRRVMLHLSGTVDHHQVNHIRVHHDRFPEKALVCSHGNAALAA